MEQSETILFIIKLALGGTAAVLAILLWSRTRDSAWTSLVAGMVTGYAATVLEVLAKFGIVMIGGPKILGIPVIQIATTAVPSVFFIIAFVLMLVRTR